MAWLGNGLSQLKGQLSDLTKEVLTDSTEEVDGMRRMPKSNVFAYL